MRYVDAYFGAESKCRLVGIQMTLQKKHETTWQKQRVKNDVHTGRCMHLGTVSRWFLHLLKRCPNENSWWSTFITNHGLSNIRPKTLDLAVKNCSRPVACLENSWCSTPEVTEEMKQKYVDGAPIISKIAKAPLTWNSQLETKFPSGTG